MEFGRSRRQCSQETIGRSHSTTAYLPQRLQALAIRSEQCEKLVFDAHATRFQERLWHERSMRAIVALINIGTLRCCAGRQRSDPNFGHAFLYGNKYALGAFWRSLTKKKETQDLLKVCSSHCAFYCKFVIYVRHGNVSLSVCSCPG